MALRIEIDREKCMGSGNCSFWAPATFDLGDDGVAFVKEPGVGSDEHDSEDPDSADQDSVDQDSEDKVLLAASGCPTQAISVWRDDERLA